MQKTPTIGIDFGTTNTVAAIMGDLGAAKVLPNSEGEDLTPTVIGFEDKVNPIVGREAFNQALRKFLSKFS